MSKHSLSTFSFSEKKMFFIKIFVGLFIFAVYINLILPQYEQGFNASLIDKVRRLKDIETSKIVLIGNSNLAFGINSELLENEIGMPVVNMGLHGALGNAFHEEMAKLNVRPGDIYIICHLSYKDNDEIGNAELAWITVENHFSLWNLLRFSDIKDMIEAFPVYLKKSLTLASSGEGNRDRISETMYARKAFNKYGDIRLLRYGMFYNNDGGIGYLPQVGNITVNRINELNRFLISKGATLLIAGYPIRNGSHTNNYSHYISFQKELQERLDCPVISNYVDYMFDYRYFYDSNWHLNSEGAKLRTMQLISDLKEWRASEVGVSILQDKYIDIISDVNLPHIDDFYEYIDLLNNAKSRYTIFISFKNNPSLRMNTEVLDKLKALGITVAGSGDWKNDFAAVVEKGVVVKELIQSEKIEISGEVDNGNVKYLISNNRQGKKLGSSILLNGEECSENVNGLNLVIFSNETHRRLDEVGFDFSSFEPKAHRFLLTTNKSGV